MPIEVLGNNKFRQVYDSVAKAEFGDLSKLDFQPVVKLTPFGDDEGAFGSFKLNALSTSLSDVKPEELAFANSALSCLWKPTPKLSGFNEYGGLDWIITLLKKPDVPYLNFDFDNSKLVAYHQPELTAAVIAEGCFRPDHVINSVAFYHSSKGGLVLPADVTKHITTGKAFHLYRMLMVDAKGNKTWTNWTVESGSQCRLWLDKAFLDTATYPVRIEPAGDTFGYSSSGPSFTSASAIATYGPYAAVVSCPSAGTVNSVNCYFGMSALADARMALYEGTTYKSQTAEFSRTASPYSLALADAVTLSATTYRIAVKHGSNSYVDDGLKYDSGGEHGYDTTAYASAFPSPWSDDGSGTRKYSLWVDYTASGGATTVTPSKLAIVTTGKAPVLRLVVTPAALALTTSAKIPSIVHGTVVTPTALALILTKYAPVLREVITAIKKALAITTYVPSVGAPVTITPSKLALEIVSKVPVLSEMIVAGKLSLTTSTFVVQLKESLTAAKLALITSLFAPVLKLQLTATTLSLTLTSFAVQLREFIVVAKLALITTRYAPTVTGAVPPAAQSGSNIALKLKFLGHICLILVLELIISFRI